MMNDRYIKIAVIYARYSDDSQSESSIEGQLKVCYEFAKRQGYSVITEYIDRATTGTNDKRPEFLRMIEDSSKRLFEFIIVYQLDRFARNRYDSATYKARLKKNGVRVLSARENISDDASGILMESVLEGMAEYFSVELSQKITRGMELNAEKGLSNGGRVPLGYQLVPVDPSDKDSKKTYAIDEVSAAVVRSIYEKYAAGNSVVDICDALNRQHIKTSSGTSFNKNSLRVMLQNKRYIGVNTYKGREIPGGFPRIISDDLFYRVQDVMSKNKKAPARARAKEEYLLTTKLFCGHCRNMMVGVSGTSKSGAIHNYYSCNGRKKCGCKKANVKKDYIEDLVVNLARTQLTDNNINKIAVAVTKICEKERDSSNSKRLKRLLKEYDKAISNLLNAIEQGQAVDIISQRLKQKQIERSKIEKELALDSISNVELTAPEIRFFLTHMRDGDINDISTRRLLITVLINTVYLYDDRLTVIFNAADKPVKITQSLIDEIEGEVFAYSKDRCS